MLQAALDNLLRRGLLPACRPSLALADRYVAALSLPPEQLLSWAREHRGGYTMRHLSAIVLAGGVGATTLKKKEQQETVAALQELCAAATRD